MRRCSRELREVEEGRVKEKEKLKLQENEN
jgi:hypothetical protein